MLNAVKWRVKTEDGSEYGPVDEVRLLAWASEGRITPGTRISSDGKNWIPASQKSDLGMKWLVEMSFGEYYGPFHQQVIQELRATKQITSKTRIFRLLGEADAAESDENAKLKASCQRIKAERDEAVMRVKELAEELDETRDELANAIRQAEEMTADVGRLNNALAAARKRESASSERARDNNATLEQTKTALEDAKSSLGQAEEREKTLAAALATSDQNGKTLAAELEATKAELGEAKSSLEVKNTELAAAKSELDTTKSALGMSKSALEAVKSELEQTKRRLEGVRSELAKSEQRSEKLCGLLAAAGARERELAKNAEELKQARQSESMRMGKLAEELESTEIELERERKTSEGLKAALEKTCKKMESSNLFQGKSRRDLSFLELAAQQELARMKRGQNVFHGGNT